MESAIPAHLQCARTLQSKLREDRVQPYPSFAARFNPEVTSVVMAYFGVQYKHDAASKSASQAVASIGQALAEQPAPSHTDRVFYVDPQGYRNTLTVAYWDNSEHFDVWFSKHAASWTLGSLTSDANVGVFTEIVRPSSDRFETLLSSDSAEGVAKLAANFSAPILEHGYWGSMRDRVPLSQTDHLHAAGTLQLVADGKYRKVIPHENVCLIRSGQDLTQTDDKEREMYKQDVQPVLLAAMDFLSNSGLSIGCYSNRFVTQLDQNGESVEKTFGLSWWQSLAHLEQWAKSHETHLKIFGAAVKHLGALGHDVKLKLYHEVSVATASGQLYEYWNCHDHTGMLRAVSTQS